MENIKEENLETKNDINLDEYELNDNEENLELELLQEFEVDKVSKEELEYHNPKFLFEKVVFPFFSDIKKELLLKSDELKISIKENTIVQKEVKDEIRNLQNNINNIKGDITKDVTNSVTTSLKSDFNNVTNLFKEVDENLQTLNSNIVKSKDLNVESVDNAKVEITNEIKKNSDLSQEIYKNTTEGIQNSHNTINENIEDLNKTIIKQKEDLETKENEEIEDLKKLIEKKDKQNNMNIVLLGVSLSIVFFLITKFA